MGVKELQTRDYKNHTDRVIITNSKSRNKIPKEIHNLRAKKLDY